MTAGWCIRPACNDDLDAIHALACGASLAPQWNRDVFAGYLPGASEEDGAFRRTMLLAVHAASGEIGGFIAGRTGLWDTVGNAAEIENIAVSQRFRRQGIGRRLCSELIAWARPQGAVRVELEVRTQNADACSLYLALGFVTYGRRDGYYQLPYDDAWLMRLNLV